MNYRIIERGDDFVVQRRCLFFWMQAYIYFQDYSRYPAVFDTYEDACDYLKLKPYLEDCYDYLSSFTIQHQQHT